MITTSQRVRIDRREIERTLKAKRRKVLFRTCAYGLKVMRNRIKSRKKVASRVGQAPFSKTRRLKKASSFEVDLEQGRGQIGFFKFPSASKPMGGKTVPSVIDAGGREKIRIQGRLLMRPDGRERLIQPKEIFVQYGPRPLTDPVKPTVEQKLKQFAAETPLAKG